MTRNPSGLAKALSSLACLVGVRDGLERSSVCVGVLWRGDLSQPVTATIWRGDTPLCAWLSLRFTPCDLRLYGSGWWEVPHLHYGTSTGVL